MVGNELLALGGSDPLIAQSKLNKRSMFDRNVVYNAAAAENMLDVVFARLGLVADSQIDFPVALSEPLCNPNYARAAMSELIFECYQAPALTYFVDVLAAFYLNRPQSGTGLAVHIGHNTSHIVPIDFG